MIAARPAKSKEFQCFRAVTRATFRPARGHISVLPQLTDSPTGVQVPAGLCLARHDAEFGRFGRVRRSAIEPEVTEDVRHELRCSPRGAPRSDCAQAETV